MSFSCNKKGGPRGNPPSVSSGEGKCLVEMLDGSVWLKNLLESWFFLLCVSRRKAEGSSRLWGIVEAKLKHEQVNISPPLHRYEKTTCQ